MKKVIGFLLFVIAFTSCSDEVRFSDPGFQATKNYAVWKASEFSASRDLNGVVTIKALSEDGSIILKMDGSAKGNYILGTDISDNKASYSIDLPNGTTYVYDTAPISGPAAAFSPLFSGGTAYTSSMSAATTTSGSGAGLTLKTTVVSGTVSSVSILSPGNNYYSGDVITITGGNNFANFAVLNVEGSNGEIIITDNTNGTITGTFQFNAKSAVANPNGSQFVGFQKGNFYRIPVKLL